MPRPALFSDHVTTHLKHCLRQGRAAEAGHESADAGVRLSALAQVHAQESYPQVLT